MKFISFFINEINLVVNSFFAPRKLSEEDRSRTCFRDHKKFSEGIHKKISKGEIDKIHAVQALKMGEN